MSNRHASASELTAELKETLYPLLHTGAGEQTISEVFRALDRVVAAHIAASQSAAEGGGAPAEKECHIVAAHILDRADQYRNDACCKVALENLVGPIARREHSDAYVHGELDDLLPRVRRISGDAQQGEATAMRAQAAEVAAVLVADLRRLESEATPGPWYIYEQPIADRDEAKRELARLVDGTPELASVLPMLTNPSDLSPGVTGCGKDSRANAQFIAALRNSAQWLFDAALRGAGGKGE